jgi:hypothetical protein
VVKTAGSVSCGTATRAANARANGMGMASEV